MLKCFLKYERKMIFIMNIYSLYDSFEDSKYIEHTKHYKSEHQKSLDNFLDKMDSSDLNCLYNSVISSILCVGDKQGTYTSPFEAFHYICQKNTISFTPIYQYSDLIFNELDNIMKYQCIICTYYTLLNIIFNKAIISLPSIIFSTQNAGINYLLENKLLSYEKLLSCDNNAYFQYKPKIKKTTGMDSEYKKMNRRFDYLSQSPCTFMAVQPYTLNNKRYASLLGCDLTYDLLMNKNRLHIEDRIKQISSRTLRLHFGDQTLTHAQIPAYTNKFLYDFKELSKKLIPTTVNKTDRILYLYRKELSLNSNLILECYNNPSISKLIATVPYLADINFPFARIPIIKFFSCFDTNEKAKLSIEYIQMLYSVETSFFVFITDIYRSIHGDNSLPLLLETLKKYLELNCDAIIGEYILESKGENAFKDIKPNRTTSADSILFSNTLNTIFKYSIKE